MDSSSRKCCICHGSKSSDLPYYYNKGGLVFHSSCLVDAALHLLTLPAYQSPERLKAIHQILYPQTSPIPSSLSSVFPYHIKAALDEQVVGQESAKRALSLAVGNHFQRISSPHPELLIPKSNLLLVGPSGSGKTHLLRALKKFLADIVPMVFVSATNLTSTGYKGDDVTNILEQLIAQTHGDISKAEGGIVCIDEFDKLVAKDSINRDINGEDVQSALLTLIEGAEFMVNGVAIKSHNILFICCGAFSKITAPKAPTSSIGFLGESVMPADVLSLTPEDIIAYGFSNELIGRLPIIEVLQPLSREDLVNILQGLISRYEYTLASRGHKLTISPEMQDILVDKALSHPTGARYLQGLLSRYLAPHMFNLGETPTHIILEKEVDSYEM